MTDDSGTPLPGSSGAPRGSGALGPDPDRVPGDPPFRALRYCSRCCMPETNEGMGFDEMGVCKACRSSEQKMRIDWQTRQEALRRITDKAKAAAGNDYDCVVPISGGKDSAFQLHIMVNVFGMTPLAVTFSHNWFTETGRYNLANILERLNVDHMMYTPNRGLVNKLARRSLPMIGDACWHCHAGVWSFPFHVAAKFRIPLIIYGESPAEFSGRTTYLDQELPKESNFAKVGLKESMKVPPEAMVGDGITAKDLSLFFPPTPAELEEAGVYGVFLGDYVFWDHERQTEFLVKEFDWREDRVEGSYKWYKSVECRMAGVHDYAKYIKRGFGRGTDFASQDVRAGLMTRDEAFDLAAKVDSERPDALDYYLEITGYTEEEFHQRLKAMRQGKATELE
ncbi:MAG: N-acetyl sugar amidotransferase [Alphaproteobacteria bacterium]|jgi:N-acetyl sugar amidotransferase|nr:N-acetyl sugar amidotransferase [Alphaproteobacteria bacterium]